MKISYDKIEEIRKSISKSDFQNENDYNIFINMLYDLNGGYCSGYPYKSLGCVLHWIYVFSNSLHIAETVQCGDGKATLHGEPFATYLFNDELEIPIFTVENPTYKAHFEKHQSVFLDGISVLKTKNLI